MSTYTFARALRHPSALTPRDPEAVTRLHAQYQAYRAAGMGHRWHPWTREAVVDLGQLFVAAYGQPPPPKHLLMDYSMPDFRAIRRLFGTLAAYTTALKP